jgi:ferric-dicitrate binding protein FerR (iron transport regulator)
MTTRQPYSTPEPDERDVFLARTLLGLQAPSGDAPADVLLGFLSEYKETVEAAQILSDDTAESMWMSISYEMDVQETPEARQIFRGAATERVSSTDEIEASESPEAVILPLGRNPYTLSSKSTHDRSSARNHTFARTSTPRMLMGSPLLRIAAMLMVALVGGLLLWTITATPDTDLLISSASETVVYTLPDGSQITLRPHSSLFSAPVVASDGASDGAFAFRLEGEAYFDVVHNPERAFTVQTASAMVQVTGTRFVVRSYSGNETEVFLEKGGVTVQSLVSAETMVMQAGEVIRVGQNLLMQPEIADADLYLLWMTNEMLLSNRKVGDVARELSNHFNIDVRVGPRWSDERLDGRILLDSPDLVLQDIALTLGARIDLQNNVYLME